MMQALREATAAAHARLHRLPYFAALAAGDLPLASYVGHLRAMLVVHAALESVVAGPSAAAVLAVWRAPMHRRSELEQDLESSSKQTIPYFPEATKVALEWAAAIRLAAADDSVSLLGHLYVLEGATLGAMILRNQVASTLALRGGEGLRYLRHNEGHERQSFAEFGARMDAVSVDAAAESRIVAAAIACLARLQRIFDALFPVHDETLAPEATALNPEAGSLPVPSDPREVEAAVRAGVQSLRRMPYIEARYGERGRRFTSSDSAWLVTLADLDEAQAIEQVFWLGRVLAARGMPRLVLQIHLELLYEELVKAIPERRASYEKLLHAAQALQDARRRRIDDARFQALAADLEIHVAAIAPVRGLGALAVAAMADDMDGVPRALESFTSSVAALVAKAPHAGEETERRAD